MRRFGFVVDINDNIRVGLIAHLEKMRKFSILTCFNGWIQCALTAPCSVVVPTIITLFQDENKTLCVPSPQLKLSNWRALQTVYDSGHPSDQYTDGQI